MLQEIFFLSPNLLKIAGKSCFISKQEEMFPNLLVIVNEIMLRFHYRRTFFSLAIPLSLKDEEDYEISMFFYGFDYVV